MGDNKICISMEILRFVDELSESRDGLKLGGGGVKGDGVRHIRDAGGGVLEPELEGAPI